MRSDFRTKGKAVLWAIQRELFTLIRPFSYRHAFTKWSLNRWLANCNESIFAIVVKIWRRTEKSSEYHYANSKECTKSNLFIRGGVPIPFVILRICRLAHSTLVAVGWGDAIPPACPGLVGRFTTFLITYFFCFGWTHDFYRQYVSVSWIMAEVLGKSLNSLLGPKLMLAKCDKHPAVTNFTKPVTNLNFGPSTWHVGSHISDMRTPLPKAPPLFL